MSNQAASKTRILKKPSKAAMGNLSARKITNISHPRLIALKNKPQKKSGKNK